MMFSASDEAPCMDTFHRAVPTTHEFNRSRHNKLLSSCSHEIPSRSLIITDRLQGQFNDNTSYSPNDHWSSDVETTPFKSASHFTQHECAYAFEDPAASAEVTRFASCPEFSAQPCNRVMTYYPATQDGIYQDLPSRSRVGSTPLEFCHQKEDVFGRRLLLAMDTLCANSSDKSYSSQFSDDVLQSGSSHRCFVASSEEPLTPFQTPDLAPQSQEISDGRWQNRFPAAEIRPRAVSQGQSTLSPTCHTETPTSLRHNMTPAECGRHYQTPAVKGLIVPDSWSQSHRQPNRAAPAVAMEVPDRANERWFRGGISPETVGKARLSCCRRLFDETGFGGYMLTGGPSQQPRDDSLHNSSPRMPESTSALLARTRLSCNSHFSDAVTSSPAPSSKMASSSACRTFSPQVEQKRALFDRSWSRHTLRKKSPPKKHRCDMCGRAYSRSSTLRNHVQSRHSRTEAAKTHECPVCQRTFTQPSNLTAHFRTHSGERPFVCRVASCGRRFTQSSSLATHARVHSGQRPYMCIVCGRSFSDSSTRTKHIRIHTGARPYSCHLCAASFSQSGNLRRHQRVHAVSAVITV